MNQKIKQALPDMLIQIKEQILKLDVHGVVTIARRLEILIDDVITLERRAMSAEMRLGLVGLSIEELREIKSVNKIHEDLKTDDMFSRNELAIIKDVTLECVWRYDEAETEHLKLLGKVCSLLGEGVDPKLMLELKKRD